MEFCLGGIVFIEKIDLNELFDDLEDALDLIERLSLLYTRVSSKSNEGASGLSWVSIKDTRANWMVKPS